MTSLDLAQSLKEAAAFGNTNPYLVKLISQAEQQAFYNSDIFRQLFEQEWFLKVILPELIFQESIKKNSKEADSAKLKDSKVDAVYGQQELAEISIELQSLVRELLLAIQQFEDVKIAFEKQEAEQLHNFLGKIGTNNSRHQDSHFNYLQGIISDEDYHQELGIHKQIPDNSLQQQDKFKEKLQNKFKEKLQENLSSMEPLAKQHLEKFVNHKEDEISAKDEEVISHDEMVEAAHATLHRMITVMRVTRVLNELAQPSQPSYFDEDLCFQHAAEMFAGRINYCALQAQNCVKIDEAARNIPKLYRTDEHKLTNQSLHLWRKSSSERTIVDEGLAEVSVHQHFSNMFSSVFLRPQPQFENSSSHKHRYRPGI